jgi:catechol 2,3-dioxygenase-like lactoylglutathione lyase family enzyme
MDMKLELVVVPVSDQSRAKDFYVDGVGFGVDVDTTAPAGFRVVQLSPPGSACAITLMTNPADAGSVKGLHLVVEDIEAARAALVGRGVAVSEAFHYGPGGEEPGPDPERGNYNSFVSLSDPDGNSWLLQEVRRG